MAADGNDNLQKIVSSPEEASEYERWAERRSRSGSASAEDYLFAEEVSRFDVAPDDMLVAADDIRISRKGRGVSLGSEQAAAQVKLDDVSESSVRRILTAIDGERTVSELEQLAGVQPREVAALLKVAFGVLVFAPVAVASLERQLSGIEITRFPGSPYEIVRPYWQNMISVRNRAPSLEEASGSVEQTWNRLRELHVLALMGEDRATYYQPSSRISAKGIGPGALLESSSQTADTPDGTLFLSGPRVNASLIGGELYHRTLYTLLDDPKATVHESVFTLRGKGDHLLRTDRWAYIEYGEGKGGIELYDMQNDPGQVTNLAKNAKHAAVVKEMQAALKAKLASMK